MSGSTPIFGLPYVVDSDEAWKVAPTTQSLAEKIEAAMQGRVVSPDLNTLQAEAAARGAADNALDARVTALETRPVCVLRQAASQSLTPGWNYLANGAAPWVEDYDPDDLHSTSVNPTRVTIKRKGLYRATVIVPVQNASGAQQLGWLKVGRNATSALNSNTPPGWGRSSVIAVTSGDSLELTTPPAVLNVGDFLEAMIGLNGTANWTTQVQAADGWAPTFTVECLRLLA